MPLTISEWFGYHLGDWSDSAVEGRANSWCPFIDAKCTKTLNDGSLSGVCSVYPGVRARKPVVICPNRLYAGAYSVLGDVARIAFGPGKTIIHPDQHRIVNHDGNYVVAFGHRYGKELHLPRAKSRGGYFVDWILARISEKGELAQFTAVEIQSCDTTGTYRPEVIELRNGARMVGPSKSGRRNSGMNWENVNKRILPQLIYKGQVLQRERLCTAGLFFVCPTEVHERIDNRLAGALKEVPNLQPASITFLWYGLELEEPNSWSITASGRFSTTVEQVANGLTRAINLPPPGVYEAAILREL